MLSVILVFSLLCGIGDALNLTEGCGLQEALVCKNFTPPLGPVCSAGGAPHNGSCCRSDAASVCNATSVAWCCPASGGSLKFILIASGAGTAFVIFILASVVPFVLRRRRRKALEMQNHYTVIYAPCATSSVASPSTMEPSSSQFHSMSHD